MQSSIQTLEKKPTTEDSVIYNNQGTSPYQTKLFSLQSGKYLVQQFTNDEKAINFHLCDLSEKTSERIYTHEIKQKDDHFSCYLPEGPVLEPMGDTIVMKKEQLFEYRLAVQQPKYYEENLFYDKANNIAYLGDNHYIVMNHKIKEQNYFNEITNITPIKNSNLFIGTDNNDSAFFIDTESLTVQPLELPDDLQYGTVTDLGDIIAFNENSVQRIPYSEIKAFLTMKKQQIDKQRAPILNQFIHPIDLVNIVNDYTDDYCSNQNTEAKHFSDFYNQKDMLNRSIQNPFDFESETLRIKRVFK